MGLFTTKRKLEIVNGECVLDKASKFRDNADGSVTLLSRWGRPETTYKEHSIVSDTTEGLFDNLTCITNLPKKD